MKKEIEDLLNSEEGKLQINEICYLYRSTLNCFNEDQDILELCFNSLIKEIYFKSVIIYSRDFNGIVKEIENAIINYMNEITEKIIIQLKETDFILLENRENWLKNLRKKYNLTQKELSIRTGVNIFTIQNIEQGTRNGSKETIKKLTNFFYNKN